LLQTKIFAALLFREQEGAEIGNQQGDIMLRSTTKIEPAKSKVISIIIWI
jgi:hypothetical protein